jgi:hypothetical protein
MYFEDFLDDQHQLQQSRGRLACPIIFSMSGKGYRLHIEMGQFPQAVDSALELLGNYRTQSPGTYSNQHKGSPFYVMGYAAFASHDYATAGLLFDAAAAEDISRYGAAADKPALNFIRLEDRGQEVLASQIIRDITAALNVLIDDYNLRNGKRSITFDELRTHFIIPLLNSPDVYKRALITAFISFIAEWKYRQRLLDMIDHGSREPFFLHMYRGCLLFESIVKEKLTTPLRAGKNTLGPALQQMQGQMGITGNIITRCDDFDAEIQNLTANMDIKSTVEMTGKIRNTLGHNLAWPSTSMNTQKYDLAIKNIAAACIHAISTLYR